MSTRRYSLLTRLTAGLLAIVLFLALLEGVVRIVGFETKFQNRFFVLNRALDYPDVFKKDHDLFWRFRPDQTITSEFFQGATYHINSRGLRGPELTVPKMKPRVLAIGNSCTFGWGVTEDSIYIRQLGRLLDNEYEMINGAIPGYTSYQGKTFLVSDLVRLEPEVLLVLFAWNDHWAAANGIADKDQRFPPPWILNIQNLLSHLESYRLYKKLLLSAVEPSPDSLFTPGTIVYRVGLEDFYQNLQEISAIGQSHHMRVIFLTSPIPALATYYAPGMRSPMHAFHERYNDAVRRVAHDTGAELVDIAALFDQYEDLFDDAALDPIHFNAKGHAVAAEALAEILAGDSL
ncbi:SGNH/GDSL hydrolase family protein [bacterium]|nr:SGNH/GDSL hydrolase family protein [bacterium]